MERETYFFEGKTVEYSDTGGFVQRQNLFKCIEDGNVDEIDQIVDTYLEHLYALIKDDLNFAKDIIKYVWAQLNFVVVRAGIADEEARNIHEKYYRKLGSVNSPEQLIELSRSQILEFTILIHHMKLHKEDSLLIQDCYQFVHENIYEKITPSMVAKAMHFSRSYVAHKFKEETGQTLTQYIRWAKIEESKKLMKNHMELTDIAQLLGFASQSYFSEIFKQETGMTPNQFRKKHK